MKREKVTTAIQEVFPYLTKNDTIYLTNAIIFEDPNLTDPWLFAKDMFNILRKRNELHTENIKEKTVRLCMLLANGRVGFEERFFFDSITFWETIFTPIERD